MNPSRRQFTPEEKVAILRQHLVEHVPISELCERHGLQPSLFYLWQRTFFENGAAAFAGNGRHAKKAESLQQQKIERLHAKLQRKDEVLAELMEEHVQLKKKSWGTLKGAWVPHDTRDQVIDFVRAWSEKTEIPNRRFVGWLGIAKSKLHDWKQR